MDFRTRTLANGLTLASVNVPAARTASVACMIRVGSRDEAASASGISHFLEHMAFKGTETRDARAISLEIEQVGASMNAWTAKDHTVYHADLLGEHMALALDVLADVIRRSTFPPEEIERERHVILQEMDEARDDPESAAQDAFDAQAFPRQALGRPILGTARRVKAFARDDLVRHVDAYYCASNMVVIAAGDVDHAGFAEAVSARFGDLRAGTPVPREAARYVGGMRHVDDAASQCAVLLGWPVPARTDAAWPVHELLAELLGGGASSPLFQSVRERRGLAYRIDAWAEGHEDAGTLQIAAAVASRNLRVFVEVVADELRELTRRIAPEDLERVHNQQRMRIARLLESPAALAERIGLDLLESGRARMPDELLATVLGTGAGDLSRAAAAMLAREPTLALVGRAGRADPLAVLRRQLAT